MLEKFGIKESVIELSKKVEKEIKPQFEQIEENCERNSLKVLKAFQDSKISEVHFGSTTGYGYSIQFFIIRLSRIFPVKLLLQIIIDTFIQKDFRI